MIQGLAEFLPVSSSGHLALAGRLFGLKEGALQFTVVLHLATLVSVFVVYRAEIIALIKKPFQKTTGLLVAGTIPVVIIALIAGDFIEELFSDGVLLGLGFFITGAFLLLSDKIKIPGDKKSFDKISYKDACLIGLFQGIAIAPGVSRSGSVITGALITGVERKPAADFSFLLSIPAILGGAVMVLKDFLSAGEVISISPAAFAAGFITAAVSGYFAVRIMLRAIVKYKLKYFSYYVFAVGIFSIVNHIVRS